MAKEIDKRAQAIAYLDKALKDMGYAIDAMEDLGMDHKDTLADLLKLLKQVRGEIRG